MKKIKLLVIGITFLITTQAVEAQHEFSAYTGGGISTLQYNPSLVDKSLCWGGQFGLGYSYSFLPNWSVGTGVEFSFYNGKTKTGDIHDNFQITTPDGLPMDSKFQLENKFVGYKEKQKASYLNIPLIIQYQTNGYHKFYVACGMKFGIPLSASYDISASSLTVKGYSDYTGQTYEDMPTHGFSTYNDISSSGDLKLRIAYVGVLEAGMKWTLTDQFSLYTGAYFDYGFNDVRKDKSTSTMIEYNETNPADYTYNSILQSQNDGKKVVDKVYPISFGLKVRFSFGLDK